MKCPECGATTYTSMGGTEICPNCGHGSASAAAAKEEYRKSRHVPDLSPYQRSNIGKALEVLNIGWLDPYHPFSVAETSRELLDAIKSRLSEIEPDMLALGFHVCEFCGNERGTGEYHFYNPATGKGYAAPVMFYHYMECHQYAPPEEFIQAIFHKKLLREYIAGLLELEDQLFNESLTEEEYEMRKQKILSE